MERRTQLKANKHAEAWRLIGRVFRKQFLCLAALDWYELLPLSWGELSGYQQKLLREILAENPKFGPMFGLYPVAGEYKNGVTIAEAYANRDKDGHTFRDTEQQSIVTGAGEKPVIKHEGDNVVRIDFGKRERVA